MNLHEKKNRLKYEVELKFPLMFNTITKKQVRAKNEFENVIRGQDFIKKGRISHIDIYFQHPCKDFKESDEALRIRTINRIKTAKEENVLTYKGAKLFKIGKTRQEIELEIKEKEIVKELLIALGFEESLTVRKVREYWKGTYKKSTITLTIDQVEQLGLFVELETTATSKSDAKTATKQLQALGQLLGLKNSIRKSYLELLWEKSKI